MAPISSEDNKKTRGYVAFFDLDHTLINANSGKLLVQHAYNSGMMTRSDIFRALWLSFLFRCNLRDTEKIISDMVAWIAGFPEKKLEELATGLFENRLVASITPSAISEITFHREQSARLVILSSSLSHICKKIAGHLQFDDVICTSLEVSNGILTGSTTGPLCFGSEKLIRLIKYCEKHNTSPEDSWYYGDSVSDFPVLKSVGHPVCINPDRKLKRLAEKHVWKVRHWT